MQYISRKGTNDEDRVVDFRCTSCETIFIAQKKDTTYRESSPGNVDTRTILCPSCGTMCSRSASASYKYYRDLAQLPFGKTDKLEDQPEFQAAKLNEEVESRTAFRPSVGIPGRTPGVHYETQSEWRGR